MAEEETSGNKSGKACVFASRTCGAVSAIGKMIYFNSEKK